MISCSSPSCDAAPPARCSSGRASNSDAYHGIRRIPIPRGRAWRESAVERRQVISGQSDGRRAGVLFEERPPLGAGDGNDVRPAVEQPGQRDLGWGARLRGGDMVDDLEQGEIAGKILLLEARELPPPIIGWETGELTDLAAQEAPPQRAVSNESDTE